MKVLIIDDDKFDNQKLTASFRGASVASAFNMQEALHLLHEWPDLIVLDAMFPKTPQDLPDFMAGEFLDALEKIQEVNKLIMPSVILVSSQNKAAEQFDDIVEWLDTGRIRSVLAKSLANVGWEFFLAVLHHTAESLQKIRESYLEDSEAETACSSLSKLHLITRDPKIAPIWKSIRNAAKSHDPVVIHGETGSGKDIVAKAIHTLSCQQDSPSRSQKNKPLVIWEATTNSGDMLESKLFGHRKGSFTGATDDRVGVFEEANGGTLFIDEIGDLPLEVQGKLLRVIQEREVVKIGTHTPIKIQNRVIVATHRDLEDMVEKGLFRRDLYERLNVLRIEIPPLRERTRDVLLLTDHFLKNETEAAGKNVCLTTDVRRAIENGPWAGNVRSLQNFIKRIVANYDGVVAFRDLKDHFTERELADKLGEHIIKPEQIVVPHDPQQLATQMLVEIEYGPATTWKAIGENESEDEANEKLIVGLIKQYIKEHHWTSVDSLEQILHARPQNDPRRIHYYLALLYLLLGSDHRADIKDFKNVLAINTWEYLKNVGMILTTIKMKAEDGQDCSLVSLEKGKRKKKVFQLNLNSLSSFSSPDNIRAEQMTL